MNIHTCMQLFAYCGTLVVNIKTDYNQIVLRIVWHLLMCWKCVSKIRCKRCENYCLYFEFFSGKDRENTIEICPGNHTLNNGFESFSKKIWRLKNCSHRIRSASCCELCLRNTKQTCLGYVPNIRCSHDVRAVDSNGSNQTPSVVIAKLKTSYRRHQWQ